MNSLSTTYTLHDGQKITWTGDADKLRARIAALAASIKNTRRHAPTYSGTSHLNECHELDALTELQKSLLSPQITDCPHVPEFDLFTPRQDPALDGLRLAFIAALNAEQAACDLLTSIPRAERTPAEIHARDVAHEKTIILYCAFKHYSSHYDEEGLGYKRGNSQAD